MENILKILNNYEQGFKVIENALLKAKSEGKKTINITEEVDDHDCKLGAEKGCEVCERRFWDNVDYHIDMEKEKN